MMQFSIKFKILWESQKEKPVEEGGQPPKSCIHSGNAGDIIYSLPTAKELGANHYVINLCSDPGFGNRNINFSTARALAPLLLSQPYIERVSIVSSNIPLEFLDEPIEGIDFVLDRFRLHEPSKHHLALCHAMAFGVYVNLYEKWLHLDVEKSDKYYIVLCLSPRYRSQSKEYWIEALSGLDNVIAIGLPEEFQCIAGITADFVTCNDFLEMARMIQGCSLFIGNPALPYAIAEGLKVPRIVELPTEPRNAYPIGRSGYVASSSIAETRNLVHRILADSSEIFLQYQNITLSRKTIDLEATITEKDTHIENLEAALRDKESHICNLEATVRDKESHISNLETAVRDKDIHVTNIEGAIGEKEATLNRIYDSHGWKALLIYYKLRNKILPPNTKRTLVAKTIFRTILGVKRVFRRVSKTSPKEKLIYSRNTEIELLEEKIERKISEVSEIAESHYNRVEPGGKLQVGPSSTAGNEVDIQALMKEVQSRIYFNQVENGSQAEPVLWTFGMDQRPGPDSGSSSTPIPEDNLLEDRFSPIFNILSKRWDIGEPGEIPSHRSGFSGFVVRTLKRTYLRLLRPFHKELFRKQQIINYHFAEGLKRIQQGIKTRGQTVFVHETEDQQSWEQFRFLPKFSVLMPVWNSNPEYLRQAILSVVQQRYPFWELCLCDDGSDRADFQDILEKYAHLDARIRLARLLIRQGIASATNAALALATGDFVAFLDHDDELDRNAFWEAARVLDQNPGIDLLYSDEDHLSSGLRVQPRFKPAWSPDLLLSFNYICHLVIIRTSLLRTLGGLRPGFDGAQDYELLLRVTEKTTNIVRIPQILYHWRKSETSVSSNMNVKPLATENGQRALTEALERRKIAGTVEVVTQGIYRVTRSLLSRPLVSVIILTKDNLRDLKPCIESIRSKSTYQNYEIVIIDNGSENEQMRAYLSSLPYRVYRCEEPFNFSRLNNFGARQAQGEMLVFLNDDTTVITPGWLEEMLDHTQRPEVGLVGAKLLFPNGTVQHAGIVLNVDGRPTAHVFVGADSKDWGYENALQTVRNCSAVTGACMMMRRKVFEEVDGFDESYEIVFSDVDLCLKVQEKGYLIVWTPYAELQHREFGTRLRDQDPPQDIKRFVARWGKVLNRGDPYYNPNLSVL